MTSTTTQPVPDESGQQYHNLPAYLQAAREAERKSIAREIHDELGQALTTMKLELSLLHEEVLHDATAATNRIHSMKHQIDETIQTVKRIITKLRPGLLDDLGLSAALEWQAREFQKYTGIVCETEISPEEMSVDAEISTAMFRIFQETLTNVVRHAQATRISIQLIYDEQQLTLVVQDNGKGISQEEIDDPQSFGLIGIRERVQYWQGSVVFSGTASAGTTVTVRFPLTKDPPK